MIGLRRQFNSGLSGILLQKKCQIYEKKDIVLDIYPYSYIIEEVVPLKMTYKRFLLTVYIHALQMWSAPLS